jgi:drug/metabolite transporter (DMT)-like permease
MKLLIAAVVLAVAGVVLLVKRKDYRLKNLPPYAPYVVFAAGAVALLASCFAIHEP